MTFRSALLGILVVLAVVMGAPYSIWMVRSSEITWSYFPTSVGFCFVVIALVNALVRGVRAGWALGAGELATIVIMGLAATGIPTFIVGTLLAIISSPYYGATPENDCYLGPAPLEEIAEQVLRSTGPSGANTEYVLRLADALRALRAEDAHVFALAALIEELVE